jgi:large conductance mechanosensitive channel
MGHIMIKGFKEFLFRGNVIDLAIAVVIGTAFVALISAISKNLIYPIISVFGGTHVSGLSFKIISDNEATRVDLGAILTALIAFAVTAAAVYFLVIVPMKVINERRRRGEEPPSTDAPVSDEVLLLQEIRDLLSAQRPPHVL